MDDLWPDIKKEEIKSPAKLIAEQGDFLGKKTNNEIFGNIDQKDSGSEFYYLFHLVAPAIRYQYKLFSFLYPVELYPVKIFYDDSILKELYPDWQSGGLIKFDGRGAYQPASTEAELLEILKKIFNAEKTKKIINGLLTQLDF